MEATWSLCCVCKKQMVGKEMEGAGGSERRGENDARGCTENGGRWGQLERSVRRKAGRAGKEVRKCEESLP